jgi:hypothetical protein
MFRGRYIFALTRSAICSDYIPHPLAGMGRASNRVARTGPPIYAGLMAKPTDPQQAEETALRRLQSPPAALPTKHAKRSGRPSGNDETLAYPMFAITTSSPIEGFIFCFLRPARVRHSDETRKCASQR